MIDLPVPSLLHTVNIEHDRNRAEHHNEEAHIRQNRNIGNKQLPPLLFPYRGSVHDLLPTYQQIYHK